MMRRPRRMMGWASPYARPSAVGRVPQFRLSRLGQDSGTSWDWSQFETTLPSLATAITAGTANIIRASNAPQVAAANPYAILATQNPAALSTLTNPLSSISPTTMLVIAAAILAALAFSHDER